MLFPDHRVNLWNDLALLLSEFIFSSTVENGRARSIDSLSSRIAQPTESLEIYSLNLE